MRHASTKTIYRRVIIGVTAVFFGLGHGEQFAVDTCGSGGDAGTFQDDGYSNFLLQADIRMQMQNPALRSDLASSVVDQVFVELEAQENEMCNKEAKLPGPVHSRKFVLNDEWKERCASLPHEGLWEPPSEWGEDAERNWCWAYVKIMAHDHEMDGRPPDWWFCQEEAAKEGLAPDPRTLPLQPLLNHELCDRSTDAWDLSGETVDSALHWFNTNVDIYVLNMPKDTGRLENITARMNQLGIPFTRVDGVSLSKPWEMAEAKNKGLLPQNWSYTKQAKANNHLYASGGQDRVGERFEVGLGTAGCSAAHLNAMSIASESKKPLALILEDDVKLDSQFVLKVKKLLYEEAPCDWEVMNLHLSMAFGECVSSHLARVHPDGNEAKQVCGMDSNWSFAAVLYKVSKLQKVHDELWKVVWNTSSPKCNIHDIAFASLADKFNYYGVPTSQFPGLMNITAQSSSRFASNSFGLDNLFR